jgi:hypothetical protein
MRFKKCPAERAPCAGGGRSHALLLLRVDLPLVGTGFWLATIGSTNAKPNTRHEVTAARVGRLSGRTAICFGVGVAVKIGFGMREDFNDE